jgi:hypothetical protein
LALSSPRTERLLAAVSRVAGRGGSAEGLRNEVAQLKLQIGRAEARVVRALPPGSIRDAEFKVFSQFGEDGIIQHLLAYVPVPEESEMFVEIGTGDYTESNTRFLLWKDNWRGVIVDSAPAHAAHLDASEARWRHDIEPVTAFVDRDNIDSLLRGAGAVGDIGLLSLDVDGNDVWVLERLSSVSPRVLVVEYNSTFGPDAAISVPYDPGFRRDHAHWSHLYWGASLAAFAHVADAKGYDLVGGNTAGNNAFFVRRDVRSDIPVQTVAEAYAPSRFRESRDREGNLSLIGPHHERLALIADLPVVDVRSGETDTIAQATGRKR